VEKISPEDARKRLENRRARLARLIELDAPPFLIEKERELIADAIYALETGQLRQR